MRVRVDTAWLVALVGIGELAAARSNPTSAKNFDTGCIAKEREALLKFKKGLIDFSGDRLSSWVRYNFFHGTRIPKFIGSLENLRHLDFLQASFTGLVPSTLGNMSNLELLDLSTSTSSKLLLVSDLKWGSSLSSMQRLFLSGIDLSNAKTSWLQVVDMLPSYSVVVATVGL
ncbi:hypothetical protein QYF36_002650 [Acer negundo]|nr:hypothetical protein QYF36_002650 [Acer negundo]